MTQLTDEQIVEQWLQQESPKPEELTREDVWNAYIASDVLGHYRQPRSKYMPFELDRSMAGLEAGVIGWDAAMERVKRGIAALNGYLLVHNARVPVWQDAPEHREAVVSCLTSAGYVALMEHHRTMSLVPADDLITISAAATILFGDNSQSHRVSIAEYIDDGYLQEFRAKDEANPQKSRRVSKRQVVKLKM